MSVKYYLENIPYTDVVIIFGGVEYTPAGFLNRKVVRYVVSGSIAKLYI